MKKNANGGNSAKTSSKTKAEAKVTVKNKAISKAEAADVAANTLTKKQVKKIVSEVNQLASDTVERGMLAIGLLILEKVFKGILEAVFSRNPFKSKSLQEVSKDPDLRVDRRRLGEWVRAAYLSKNLIARKVDCSNLCYSHFAALLQVEGEDTCDKLAAKANKGNWSARKLAEEIDKLNPATASEKKSKDLVKLLDNPQALMKDKDAQKILESPRDLEKLPFDIRMHIAKRAEEDAKIVIEYINLLKLARKNIALIELGDGDVIDVEATDVQTIDVQPVEV